MHPAIAQISRDERVPGALLNAICYIESAHNSAALARKDGDGTDSLGLCQIKESTARWVGYTGLRVGLFDPHTNARYAARYLRYQLRRYKGSVTRAIAAYNAGSARYTLSGRFVNQRYVEKVLALK